MSEEKIQVVEEILQNEVNRLREKTHEMANEMSVLKVQVYKLENKPPLCGEHSALTTTLTKIECAVENIEKGITQSRTFKNAIIGSLIGMAVVIMIQLGGFLYLYGKMVNQIEVNTHRLSVLEDLHSGRATQN